MKWTEITQWPNILKTEGGGIAHESVMRAYHILEEVKAMLARGDSKETILKFIAFVEGEK